MSRGRWALLSGLCAALLTVLLLAVDGRQQRSDPRAEQYFRGELGRLRALVAELDRELLRARSGLAPHHDELSRALGDLRRLQEQLLRPPADLGFVPGPELSAALVRVSSLSREQERGLERFTVENAQLRGARRALPGLLAELRERSRAMRRSRRGDEALSGLLVALAQLDAAPLQGGAGGAVAGGALARWSQALDELERAASAGDWGAEAARVLQHGRLLAQRLPGLEELTKRLSSLPLARAVEAALDGYERERREALSREQRRRGWQVGFTALAVLLGVVLILLQLRDNERARRRAELALEQAERSREHAERSLERAERSLDGAYRALHRERDRQREQQRLESAFVSGMAQQFRGPLANILSSSRMLGAHGERWSSERRQEHFARIASCAAQLKKLLEELVVVRRADAGQLVAAPAPLDLRGFCEQLIDTVTRSSRPAPAQRVLALGPPSSASLGARVCFSFRGERKVCLDQRLLSHVLGNLLENAIKYSRAESEVGFHVSVSEGGLRCVVQDSGVGISAEELPRLGHAFRRGSNVGNVPGNGLGLAVAHRALEALGSKIEVHSEPGRGSEFEVWLPLSERPPRAARPREDEPVGSRTMEVDTGEIELLPAPHLSA